MEYARYYRIHLVVLTEKMLTENPKYVLQHSQDFRANTKTD